MPRNASGVYSLPESAFVAGTIIESAKVNSDLSDIATALTQSLATTGVSTMTGQFKAANGAVGAPGIVFSGSTTTGFYRSAADEISWAAAGVAKGVFGATGNVTFSGNLAVGGTLAITGAATFASTITIGNLSATGSLSVGTDLHVGGDLDIVDDVSVGGDINTVTNIFVAGFIQGTEIATPTTASANKARLFVRDVSGNAEFAIIDDTGNVLAILNSVIIQRTYTEYTSTALIATAIPDDNTIPQVGEGTEILSSAITLRKATNRVRARFSGWGGTSDISKPGWIAALFLNGGANAIDAAAHMNDDGDVDDITGPIAFEFEHAPGTVGPHTYSVRVGPIGSSLRMNGEFAGALFGGVSRATLILEEINV